MIARALGVQSGLPWIADIDARTVESDLLAKLPITFAKQNEVIPLRRIAGAVEVATANPLNLLPLDDLRVLMGVPIRVLVSQLQAALRLAFGSTADDLDTEERASLGLLAQNAGSDGLMAMLEACVEADRLIDRRVQLALILEQLADKLCPVRSASTSPRAIS